MTSESSASLNYSHSGHIHIIVISSEKDLSLLAYDDGRKSLCLRRAEVTSVPYIFDPTCGALQRTFPPAVVRRWSLLGDLRLFALDCSSCMLTLSDNNQSPVRRRSGKHELLVSRRMHKRVCGAPNVGMVALSAVLLLANIWFWKH